MMTLRSSAARSGPMPRSTRCRCSIARVLLSCGLIAGLSVPLAIQAAKAPVQGLAGEQIYSRGISPSGEPMTAFVGAGAAELPASALPCGSCHGPDGRGRPEGGVTPSDITWNHLTKSYGHRHDYGRDHPAFDEASVIAAITGGIDPAGNQLDSVMPRYSMSAADVHALLGYLKQLEHESDAGLTDDSIHLATLLPLSGPAAPLGQALSAVTTAIVADLNAAGGLHGRRIELQVLPLGDTRAEALIHLEQAIARDEIFALLGSYSVGFEEDLYTLVEREGVPLIGPLSPQAPANSALSRYTFQLFASREQQARILVDYAAERTENAGANVMVAGASTGEGNALAAAIDEQGRAYGWPALQSFNYEPGALDAERLAAALRDSDAQQLFFFGSAAELSAALDAAARAGQAPAVFLLADAVTPALFEAPAAFDGRIFAAYPSLPGDVTAKGRAEFGALMEKHGLSNDYLSVQVAAYAAGAVLSEALKRAGRDLSRERLISALESLHRFETGVTPPLTFTLNEHVGASGAHLVQLEFGAQRYTPVGTWRDLD